MMTFRVVCVKRSERNSNLITIKCLLAPSSSPAVPSTQLQIIYILKREVKPSDDRQLIAIATANYSRMLSQQLTKKTRSDSSSGALIFHLLTCHMTLVFAVAMERYMHTYFI